MKIGTKVLIPILGLTVLMASAAVGTGAANAFGFEEHDTLMQKLVDRFNLNKAEVEEFFDEQRQRHQDGIRARVEKRLRQLVNDGKLTEDQKSALIRKQKEWRSEREQERKNFQNMSREENQQTMEKYREEMDKWLEENGIDKERVRLFGNKGVGRHKVLELMK